MNFLLLLSLFFGIMAFANTLYILAKPKRYWVFRKFQQLPGNRYKQSFALHYGESFSTYEAAESAVTQAKVLETDFQGQEYIILQG